MPVWLVLLYFQSVFKALADNVELSIRKMSSKSQQRETRASLKCKGSIQAELLQKDCVLQPQKFRSQFQCSPGSNLDFLSECFSLMINQSLPLPWKFFSVSGVKCLGTSSAVQFRGEKKEENTTAYRVCVFISFNRLQIQVRYDTLIFLQFNISLTQYWLLFKSSVVITSWLSQLWTNDKIILLSKEIQII